MNTKHEKLLRTARGQAARIILTPDNQYSIQLYANDCDGNSMWHEPCKCFNNKFPTYEQALIYFTLNANSIHG